MANLDATQTRSLSYYLNSRKITLKAIFAVDDDHCIGYDNNLIFHNREDLKFFREKTLNSVVIMGRKTFDSLGRPLKDRVNIVITHNPEEEMNRFQERKAAEPGPGDASFFSSYMEALEYINQLDIHTAWVIGGKKILSDLQRLISTYVITHYRFNCRKRGQEVGLLPPDEPEDDSEPFDPKKLVRIASLMRWVIMASQRVKLAPSKTFTAPNGEPIVWATYSYTRPNSSTASKLAKLQAEELLTESTDTMIDTERKVTNKIMKRRF